MRGEGLNNEGSERGSVGPKKVRDFSPGDIPRGEFLERGRH